MVASGLPVKNGNKHAAEIGTMALGTGLSVINRQTLFIGSLFGEGVNKKKLISCGHVHKVLPPPLPYSKTRYLTDTNFFIISMSINRFRMV